MHLSLGTRLLCYYWVFAQYFLTNYCISHYIFTIFATSKIMSALEKMNGIDKNIIIVKLVQPYTHFIILMIPSCNQIYISKTCSAFLTRIFLATPKLHIKIDANLVIYRSLNHYMILMHSIVQIYLPLIC